MRALVYHGPGRKVWEEVADPEVTDDSDIIVRVEATTICGTDLRILHGDVPEVPPGTVLGHEAVGKLTGRLGADVAIEAVGTPEAFELAVKLVRPGGRGISRSPPTTSAWMSSRRPTTSSVTPVAARSRSG
jgi:threonine dehydrogenase-like Zn-dependent dehydrogenase